MNAAESMKQLRAERYAKGLCIYCGNPHNRYHTKGKRKGKKKLACAECASKDTTGWFRKERLLREGKCIHCGKEIDRENKNGKRANYCSECVTIINERTLKDKDNKKAAGLCVYCGKEPAIENEVYCLNCKRKERKRKVLTEDPIRPLNRR